MKSCLCDPLICDSSCGGIKLECSTPACQNARYGRNPYCYGCIYPAITVAEYGQSMKLSPEDVAYDLLNREKADDYTKCICFGPPAKGCFHHG
jgi:hypothetical protein